ncbi:hypothetical protein ACJD0Z_15675 [Flavobacteriaceae bacterium M23B6Z8]
MNKKLIQKSISIKKSLQLNGGTKTNEMYRETYLNRRKSADKLHN